MNLSPQEVAEDMLKKDTLQKCIELSNAYIQNSPNNKGFWKQVVDILIKKVPIL